MARTTPESPQSSATPSSGYVDNTWRAVAENAAESDGYSHDSNLSPAGSQRKADEVVKTATRDHTTVSWPFSKNH